MILTRSFKIATIQYKPVLADTASENLKKILTLCLRAVRNGAELLVLPEMCLTGYIWDSAEAIAPFTEIAKGESFQKISLFCQENSCYIAYGFAETDGAEFYNSQNFVSPQGKLLATYRKTHLFVADRSWATPGNSGYLNIDGNFGRIGFGICMDLNFNDFVQFHIEHETQYLLLAVNWLDEGGMVHNYWLERLRNFGGTTIIANTYGQERGVPFCGLSGIITGNKFQQTAPKNGDYIVYGKFALS